LGAVPLRKHERRTCCSCDELLSQELGLLDRERYELAASLLAQVGPDNEHAVTEINAVVGEREQLADPVAGRACEQHEAEGVRRSVAREELQLRDAQRAPLMVRCADRLDG
jgi:hypothetical protein